MKNSLLFLIIFSIFFTNCKEKDEVLQPTDLIPPITTTGANTMGCLINGEPFIAGRDKDLWMPPKWLNFAIYKDSVFTLNALDSRLNTNITLQTIYHASDSVVELYNPNSMIVGNITHLINFDKNGAERVFIDPYKNGKLKILRNDEMIISGTFEFDAIGEFSFDTLHITQGRFDVLK